MDIDEVKKWLQSYLRLENHGHAGRLLSEEYKEYRKEDPKPDCNLMTWCVKKALEKLNS